MEVIEVTWGKDTYRQPYELWVRARSGANVLIEVKSTYKPLPVKARELPIDVSSPIGLFQTDGPISPDENERLERCLSDLLLWVIHPQLAKSPPRIILIQSDRCPLNKLIGRLGYRFPRAELTIAFVTFNDATLHTHSLSLHHNADWDGPFPPFHVDSITRTYIHIRGAIRLDLFAQGLSRYSVDEMQGAIAYGVEAKLYQAQDSILNFAETLRNSSSQIQRNAKSLPPGQQSFGGDDFEEISSLRKVAKKTYKARDEEDQSLHPDAYTGQQLSDEELFNAYADQRTSTETGKNRFEVWAKFIRTDDVHDRDDKTRFLKFVEATLKHNKYPKKYVYSLGDLTRWYRECRQGEPHGTKR